jgi:poly-gamma-glutamate capsule biosynthesis protein CapA/YwtB (metallophosphatase superfamily)
MELVFVGDVMLGRLVNEWLWEVPPDQPWGNTVPILAEGDLRICNLECALSDRGRPWERTQKAFYFRSDTKNVAVLRAAGIDAVVVANNHTLDFGYDGLEDTLDMLDHPGIARAGAAARTRPACCSTGSRGGSAPYRCPGSAWS